MESVCFAPRMRLELPERLPSLSEYLCGDDFPSPQLREDDDGNLMVHLLQRDYPSSQSQAGDCFLSEYGSRQESPENIYDDQETAGVRTWTFLDTKPPASIPTQTNCFRSGSEVPAGSYDSFPVAWEQFPTQQQHVNSLPCYSSTSSTSLLPRFPSCADVTSSSSSLVTWPKPEVTERTCSMSPSSLSTSSSTSSSRKRAHPTGVVGDATGRPLPDDPEARKLELKRAKNREAAQRCQQRKQERIARLEGKVSRLREQNVALTHTVTGLRDQVGWLRRQIANHAHNGCHIVLPPFNPV